MVVSDTFRSVDMATLARTSGLAFGDYSISVRLGERQSGNESVQAMRIVAKGTDAGHLCFGRTTEGSAQLYVRPHMRRQKIAAGAIRALQGQVGGRPIGFANIDGSCLPPDRFLEKTGFSRFAIQRETALAIDGEQC
jgi:hypothetical protein